MLSLLLFGSNYLSAQDIEGIIKSKPFEFKGRVLAGLNYNYTSATNAQLTPFSYRLLFNSTVSIYSFDFPFGFTIIDSQFSETTPTLRFKLNPKYKWAQLYLGSNVYNFSEFTVSGQNIDGFGISLQPKGFEFTAFYGNIETFMLQQYTEPNGYELDFLPTYKRKAIGTKIGFSINSFNMELSGATVKDKYDENSGDFSLLAKESKPKENFVIGAKISSNLTKYAKFGIDVGASVITDDLTSNELTTTDETVENLKTILPLDINESTRFGFAGSAFFKFLIAKQSFGVNYKRIEPQYRSLGLFYINDDYQNITFNTSLNLLKGKIRLNGSYGVQKNNLDNLRASTSKRNISSLNLTVQPIKPLTVLVNYTNHSQNQEAGLVDVSSSGLPELGQVTQNLVISPIYTISNKDRTQVYSVNYSNFSFDRYSDGQLEGTPSTNQNITANYNYNHRKNKWGFRVGANYFDSEIENNSSSRYGISLGYNKSFSKKLRATINTRFNIRNSNNENGLINNNSGTLSYKISKKQSLNFSFYQVNGRKIRDEKVSDLRMSLTYALNF